jgi:hypothetical protein
MKGPPGTGKSQVITAVTIVANAMGVVVVAYSPSNASTKALAVKIVAKAKELAENSLLLSRKVHILVLLSSSHSEALALSYFKQTKKLALDDDEKSLEPHQWYLHAIQYSRQRCKKGSGDNKEELWARLLEDMELGKVLEGKDWRFFFKLMKSVSPSTLN